MTDTEGVGMRNAQVRLSAAEHEALQQLAGHRGIQECLRKIVQQAIADPAADPLAQLGQAQRKLALRFIRQLALPSNEKRQYVLELLERTLKILESEEPPAGVGKAAKAK